MRPFVAGLVLGAGSSSRLGQPKQLLTYRDKPLLQTAVDTALAARFDQVVVAIGGAAPQVRTQVDFGSAIVTENVAFTSGCSSSIVAALAAVEPQADGLVLLLGDQPGVTIETINTMIDLFSTDPESDSGSEPPPALSVCRYQDGPGHPFAFSAEVFADLAELQGDKAVWKLLESGLYPVTEVSRPGPIPPDVDTWEDYEALLQENLSA